MLSLRCGLWRIRGVDFAKQICPSEKRDQVMNFLDPNYIRKDGNSYDLGSSFVILTNPIFSKWFDE